MTASSLPLVTAPTPPTARAPDIMAGLTAVSAALVLLYALWALVDGRTVGADPVWLKPMKFAVSFLVTGGTLVLVAGRLGTGWRDGRLLRATAAVMAAAFAFEMLYITWRAARAEASHFNVGDPFGSLMYSLMGLGAGLLVVGIGLYGAVLLADREARMSQALRQAAGWGLIAAMVLTLVTAFPLGGNGGHFVGLPPPDARTWPLLGWSGSVGDLRPAHFLALHTMQALPAWVLLRERAGAVVGGREVAILLVLWVGVTLAVFAQALAGYPLVPL